MGSGKSTLGKELAEQLGYSFFETDGWIEEKEGLSVTEIFSSKGEAYFRDQESKLLSQLQLTSDIVIATGGGMPCVGNNMDLMNQLGTTIWLDVEEKILVGRLEKEKSTRPLLSNAADLSTTIRDLLEIRKPFYQKAKFTIQNADINSLVKLCG